MKTCTACGIEQPAHQFNKKKSHADGLEYWCRVCHTAYKKRYYSNNVEKTRKERLLWKKENKDSLRQYNRKYYSDRYRNDCIFRIRKNQRNRMSQLVTNKPTSFTKSVGCGSIFLKQYLESQFQLGMTWENYGLWEIDHVRPLSSFSNLSDKEQFQQAFHYTNLQPLWKIDNIKKSNKWENNNASL